MNAQRINKRGKAKHKRERCHMCGGEKVIKDIFFIPFQRFMYQILPSSPF